MVVGGGVCGGWCVSGGGGGKVEIPFCFPLNSPGEIFQPINGLSKMNCYNKSSMVKSFCLMLFDRPVIRFTKEFSPFFL